MIEWVLVFFLHGEPFAAAAQKDKAACEESAQLFEGSKSAFTARCIERKDMVEIHREYAFDPPRASVPPKAQPKSRRGPHDPDLPDLQGSNT